jgi:hypothetical protein
MSAIVIKADNRSNKILKELAERLGASVSSMDEEQYEEFLLGNLMDAEKTGKKSTRASIFKKLKSK